MSAVWGQDIENLVASKAPATAIKSLETEIQRLSTLIESLSGGSSEINLTQYTMESVEKVGLLKLDILGLRNLSILSDCLRFIPYENNGQKIDIDDMLSLDYYKLQKLGADDKKGCDISLYEGEGELVFCYTI